MKYALPLTLALLAAPSFAAAQSSVPAPPAAPAAAPATPDAATNERPTVEVIHEGGRTITRINMGTIHGDVARPYSFGITARAPLGYTQLDERRSFLRDVTSAVRRDPF